MKKKITALLSVFCMLAAFVPAAPAYSPVSFADWEDEGYTYIRETDASVGQEICVSDGTLTEVGMLLYNGSGVKLGEACFVPTEGVSRYCFRANADLGVILDAGTVYRYRFYAVVDGSTFYGLYKSFTTEGAPPADAVIEWTDMNCFPSRHSAFITARPVSSGVVTFTGSSVEVWDADNTLVMSRSFAESPRAGTELPLSYDLSSETGVFLKENTTYTYRITVHYSGLSASSDVLSFTTEDSSGKRFGIDVSTFQGRIDWETAAEYIDFAIIRCGYGSDDPENDDARFEYNASECERLGIPYGVYLYSYATSPEGGLSEAMHVIRLLKGRSPSLPVYYDLEDPKTTEALTTEERTELVRIFCSEITANGYACGVYTSYYWWTTKMEPDEIEFADRWLAAWNGVYAKASAGYSLWQYSSKGKIPGIDADVDLNYITGESVPGPYHTHSFDAVPIPADCTEDGCVFHVCICGKNYADNRTAALGHDYVDGICTRCGNSENNPFTDVLPGQWYYEPVLWAFESGVTMGVSDTAFGVGEPCTRAQIVTFLYRAAGSPEVTDADNPFTDVPEDEYYYNAVMWAVENGITVGTSETTFGPDEVCTRAQIVTFLYRAAGSPEVTDEDDPFTDVPENEYYCSAVLWALENGITVGTSETAFGPDEDCTREQVVTFLYRAKQD